MSSEAKHPFQPIEGPVPTYRVRAHAVAGALWMLNLAVEDCSHHHGAPSFNRHELPASSSVAVHSLQTLRSLIASWSELSVPLLQHGFNMDQWHEPRWWLDEFPRWIIHWPAARAIETISDLRASNGEFSNTEHAEAIQTLRTACLALIQHRAQTIAFQEAVLQSSRRQIYNFVYGLSHEINNPLANIVARAERLMNQTKDAFDKKSLATMIDQAHRAHEMLAEVMLAVRPPKLRRSPHDICDVVRSAVAAWIKQLETKITVNVSIPTEPIVCDVCPNSIWEALTCGLHNAMESSEDLGEITVSLVDLRPTRNRVRIIILDCGRGMTGKQIRNAWDLCYSGREAGRGLGIGLAKLQRIIENHSGTVYLVSAEHCGCRLELELPICSQP